MRSLTSARTVEEIRERMESLMEADERRWGVMTAMEAVRHLRGAFVMAAGDRAMKPIAAVLPKQVMKRLALWTPVRWPRSLPTVPELLETEALQGGFLEERRALLEAFERFLRVPENRTEHPMLGAMRPVDWMRWGYLHTDHHLRQFGR